MRIARESPREAWSPLTTTYTSPSPTTTPAMQINDGLNDDQYSWLPSYEWPEIKYNQNKCLINDYTLYYKDIHMPIVVVLIILAICGHSVLMFLITRKRVFNATYLLVLSMVISELCTVIAYVIRASSSTFTKHHKPCPKLYGYIEGAITLICDHFIVIGRSLSGWLVITMCGVRVIQLYLHGKIIAKGWLTVKKSINLVTVIVISVFNVRIPSFCAYRLFPTDHQACNNETKIDVDYSKLKGIEYYIIGTSPLIKNVIIDKMLLNGCDFMCLLLPLAIAGGIAFALSHQLSEMQRRERRRARRHGEKPRPNPYRRRQKRKHPLSKQNTGSKLDSAAREAERIPKRTTNMLIAVMFSYMLFESPQQIVTVYKWINNDHGHLDHCYSYLGNIMNTLMLLNYALTLPILMCMSEQLRVVLAHSIRKQKKTVITVTFRRNKQNQQSRENTRLCESQTPSPRPTLDTRMPSFVSETSFWLKRSSTSMVDTFNRRLRHQQSSSSNTTAEMAMQLQAQAQNKTRTVSGVTQSTVLTVPHLHRQRSSSIDRSLVPQLMRQRTGSIDRSLAPPLEDIYSLSCGDDTSIISCNDKCEGNTI